MNETLDSVVGDTLLYDAPSGRVLRDENGVADRPDQYTIFGGSQDDGWLVRGPSGQSDRSEPTDHTRLYRDIL